MRLLVDEVEPLAGAVEHDAEVGADGGDEALGLPHQRGEVAVGVHVAVARERVRRHHLDAQRPEHEREQVRGGGEAVVDDDPEAARPDRLHVERGQQVAGVALAHAGRIRDRADLVGGDAAELPAREVLLDLRLHGGAHLDPGRLEELDPDRLRVARADADVEAGGVALRLHEVARDAGRDHPQVGDVHARRRQPGDHRPLDHPAGRRALARRDDPGVALQRRAQRGGETYHDVRCQVDVDEARDASLYG